jgi:hypothetical protein
LAEVVIFGQISAHLLISRHFFAQFALHPRAVRPDESNTHELLSPARWIGLTPHNRQLDHIPTSALKVL